MKKRARGRPKLSGLFPYVYMGRFNEVTMEALARYACDQGNISMASVIRKAVDGFLVTAGYLVRTEPDIKKFKKRRD